MVIGNAVTPTWVAAGVVRAFSAAMGKQRLLVRPEIDSGAIGLHVDIMPDGDFETMERRTIRAGRMLADEAKRKRLRVLAELPPPLSGEAARMTSVDLGVTLRVMQVFLVELDRYVYRVDMLGSRRACPIVNT